MAEEELVTRWICQELKKQEQWGRDAHGEELAWLRILECKVEELHAEAWREVEAEERWRQCLQVELETS